MLLFGGVAEAANLLYVLLCHFRERIVGNDVVVAAEYLDIQRGLGHHRGSLADLHDAAPDAVERVEGRAACIQEKLGRVRNHIGRRAAVADDVVNARVAGDMFAHEFDAVADPRRLWPQPWPGAAAANGLRSGTAACERPGNASNSPRMPIMGLPWP